MNEILKVFPCKRCGHNYEDHIAELRCAFCWADAGYDARKICIRFQMDNLKYLEAKYEHKQAKKTS